MRCQYTGCSPLPLTSRAVEIAAGADGVIIDGCMRAVLLLLVHGWLSAASAQVINNWTNPFSARWESSSWSLGILPASNHTVNITNAGSKAVEVSSATLAGFPSSLTVSNLAVAAPTNALSTLLLNYAGLGAPLKVLNKCSIGTNGKIANLFSWFEVNGSAGSQLLIDADTSTAQGESGANFAQLGGLTVVNGPVFVRSGTMAATNAGLTLGEVTLGSTVPSYGYFTQDGGSIAVQRLTIENGGYTFASGTFYAIEGTEIHPFGNFYQRDGTNYGDITLIAPSYGYGYTIGGGLAKGNLLTVASDFWQFGGLVEMQAVDWSSHQGGLSLGTLRSKTFNIHGNALVFLGAGNIVPGRVETDFLTISNSARVSVTTYELFVTNKLELRGDSTNAIASLYLAGGLLRMGAINLHEHSTVDLSGPASMTELSTGLSMEGGQLTLGNGTLQSPYEGVGSNATFWHRLGTNLVHGVLSISGSYHISGGTLWTKGLYLRGALLLEVPQSPWFVTSFTNTGLTDLGGTLRTGWSNAWLGQVRLSTNATIGFTGPRARLHFAASSAVAWTPGAMLSITNWNGSNSVNSRIYFGVDASGLNASQLAQIQFINPGGYAPGVYPARLLSTGELVPAGPPFLQSARYSSGLILTWPSGSQLLSATNVAGPYEPVPNASSPRTNFFTKPQEFFMLRNF